jgi:hypothetical protein
LEQALQWWRPILICGLRKENLSQDKKPLGRDSKLATSTTSKHSVTVQFITLYSSLTVHTVTQCNN